MATDVDFIKTIEDSEEVSLAQESSDSDDETLPSKRKKKKTLQTQGEFDDTFKFDVQNDNFDGWADDFALKYAKKKATATTLDEKINKKRRQLKTNNVSTVLEDDDNSLSESEADSSEDETFKKADTLRIKGKKSKKQLRLEAEEDEKIQFSENIMSYDSSLSFQDMNLSRPLLKALASMKFNQPTPIQTSTIPIALLGRDICACAATGTGKTAAFMLPVLERLLYKPKQAAMTRVLVLTPTRELAVQIHQVSRQLAQFTKVQISLSAGGLDIKAQEAALRLGPDIVIATPGRLIDHLHNAPSFNLQSIEVLILDEADRMLDEYFAEQMKEVIRLCSRTRQTMLFSATMTEEVKDLAAVSLSDPVKIFMNENTDVAFNLKQEFIRVRPNREGDREAILAALVSRTFHDHCIVFIQTKKQAHRLHILLGLLGIRVGELHGNLSQAQRLEALNKFKEAEIDVLLATDLAARGLDVQGISTVINFTMPNTVKHYIHRVGRTARAGKSGRSVSLVGEQERKILKEVVKRARSAVKSRVIPQEVIMKYRDKISKLEKEIIEIMKQETEEKMMRISELQINKAQKIIEHHDEIMSRPKRTWFQTHRERMQNQAALRLGEFSEQPNKKMKKVKKKTTEDRVSHEILKAQEYAARVSKRDKKPKRLRAFMDDDDEAPVKSKSKKKKKESSSGRKAAFDRELTSTSGRSLKQFRAGPSYDEKKKLGIVQRKGGKKFKSKSRFKRR